MEQMLANPAGRLHGFDLSFAFHGAGTRWVGLGPDERPRAIFAGIFAADLVGAVVVGEADR